MSGPLRICARVTTLAGLAAAGLIAASSAAFAEARTTRIETRPFYGATVTLEEGVRVFRPLPRHDRVIINPEGKTPLSLEFNETHNHYLGHGGNVNNVTNTVDTDGGAFGSVGRHGGRAQHGSRHFRSFGQGHRGHGGGFKR